MTTSPTLLLERKRAGRPIVVLTAYDAPTAAAEQAAGIDVILVGDSVGTNILGYASEREICINWQNSTGKPLCSFGEKCKYAYSHFCSNCGLGNHGFKTCRRDGGAAARGFGVQQQPGAHRN